MTDIVEKLRMRSALSRDRGWHVGKHEDADTDDEAADRIEALEAALRGVLNADGVTDEIAKLARDALGEDR